MSRTLFAVCVVLLFGVPGYAETIYVPDHYATIQGAIDAASEGDTIIVRPQTYYEHLNFLGKAITVQSEQGPEVTIIDAGDEPRQYVSVVSFFNEEGRESVLEGFTLRNGTGTDTYPPYGMTKGGGVFIYGASPTITGNIVSDNHVHADGGGIYAQDGAPLISDNIVENNSTDWYNGGGIGCWYCSPTITDNEVRNNTTGAGGAGIMVEHCVDADVSGNAVSGNVAPDYGGGIRWESTMGTIENNTITGNLGDGGGGIHAANSSLVITQNEITDNDSTGAGGGISAFECTALIQGNTVAGNTSDSHGGGIDCGGTSSDITFVGNTISGNTADGYGGGIHAGDVALAVIANEISGNTAHDGGGGIEFWGVPGTTIVAGNVLANNTATGGGIGGKGGGLKIESSSSQVINNVIVGNTVFDVGGGVYLGGGNGPTTIAGNLIAGNRAVWHGGGIWCDGTSPLVADNTIYANIAGESGGGIRCATGATIVNTILWGNIALTGREIKGSPDVRFCNVQGGWSGDGNIDGEPAFADPVGPDGVPGTMDDDLRLTACSAGMDAGDDVSVPRDAADLDGDGDTAEPLPLDLGEDPRFVDTVDMGCYEFQPGGSPCPAYVDCNGNGIRDEIDVADCDGSPWCLDCNGNSRPDECDLVSPPPGVDHGRAYWRFEHGPGPVLDSGPYGLDGVAHSVAYTEDVALDTIPQNGLANTLALGIGGVGHVLVEDPFNLTAFGDWSGSDDPSDFTVEAWVRLNELGGTGDASQRQYLVQKKELAAPGSQMDFSVMVQGGNIQQGMDEDYGKTSGFTGRELVAQFGMGSGTWSVTSHLEIDDFDWHYVSAANDTEANAVRFGLDDVFETVFIDNFEPHIWSYGPLLIGAHSNAAGEINQHVRGVIDELRISASFRPEYELLAVLPIGATTDCNDNGVPDDCDITDGTLHDDDGDGWPDECECPGDLDGDGTINLSDLGILLAHYGASSGMTYWDGDLDFDGDVDLSDLGALLGAYGETCE